MSWLYLPGGVADCSEANCSDGEPSAMSKKTNTPSQSLKRVSETESLTTLQSGMMLEHSTGSPGLDVWISSLEVSPANHLALMENDREKTTNEIFGQIPPGSFARYDPDTHSWRTFQASFLLGTLEPYSQIWPRSGIVQSGIVYQRRPSAPITKGTGFGLLPTIRASEKGNYQYDRGDHNKPRMTLTGYVKKYPTPTETDWKNRETSRQKVLQNCIGGQLNPDWIEWLMGWPIGWTALEPLEMDRYRQWLEQHGIYY